MSFKRGSALDIPIYLGIILAGAITYLMLNTLVSNLTAAGGIFADSIWTDFVSNSFGLLDSLFVFSFIMGFLFIIILAGITRSTPIMFAAGIVMIIVSVFIAPTIANIYNEFATNPSVAAGHTNLDAFFAVLPTLILVVGGIIVVVNLVGRGGSE